jgi:hypothetical protein
MTKRKRPTQKPDPSMPRAPGDEVEIFDLVELRAAALPNGHAFGTVLDIDRARGQGPVLYRVRNMANLDELIRVRREEIHRSWSNGGPDGGLVRSLLKAREATQ